MIIGTFIHDKTSDSFSGDIATLHFQFSPVEITPADKKHEKGPDYRVTFDSAHGIVELGSVWKRTSQQGNDYLSVELDGPFLAQPLHVNMTMPKNGKSTMYWNRRKPEAEVTKPKPAAKKAA